MNIQIHDATGSSPYELVFGQRPRAVIFTSGKSSGPLLEEDLEADGIIFKGFQENEDDEKQLTAGECEEDDCTLKRARGQSGEGVVEGEGDDCTPKRTRGEGVVEGEGDDRIPKRARGQSEEMMEGQEEGCVGKRARVESNEIEGDGGDTRSESLASTQKHLKVSSLCISFTSR